MTSDLKWIAALLASDVVAPHRNFRSSESPSPEAALALHFLGRGVELAEFTQSELFAQLESAEPEGALLLRAAVDATTTGKVEQGLEGLAELMRTSVSPVVVATAGLVAATAAAELDRLDVAIEVIGEAFGRMESGPNAPLLKALLLQQMAHRLWDLGETGLEQARSAAAELEKFDPSKAESFELNEATTSSSAEVLADIAAFVADAAVAQQVMASTEFNDRLARVRSATPAIAARLSSRVGNAALELQERAFSAALQADRGTMTWRSEAGDEAALHALFVCEFSGHPLARHYRKITAETRAMLALSHGGSDWYLREALRLFRHAGDSKNVATLATRMGELGPLRALQDETTQAAKGWQQASQLDEALLAVIRIGSATLDPHEAADAFTRIAEVRNEPRQQRGLAWQSRAARFEPVWRTLFALARTANRLDDAIRLFLSDLREVSGDEFDHYSARVLPDPSSLSDAARKALSDWLSIEGANGFPMTRSAVVDRVHPEASVSLPPNANIEDVRQCLNAANVNDASPNDADLRTIAELLTSALAEKRAQASQRMHTFGGPIAASLAVAALHHGADVVDAIADLLLDPAVPREEKADALDRLAGAPRDVPPQLVARLTGNSAALLSGASTFGGSTIEPFPEAVRVIGALGLASSGDLQALVSQLLGSSSPEAREEGIHTLRRWVLSGRTDEWIDALLVLCSQSSDANIRGVAGNSLCLLAARGSGLNQSTEARIAQMLHEDGSLIPRQILNGVKELGGTASPALLARIRAMAEQHIDRNVRTLAADVVGSLRPES